MDKALCSPFFSLLLEGGSLVNQEGKITRAGKKMASQEEDGSIRWMLHRKGKNSIVVLQWVPVLPWDRTYPNAIYKIMTTKCMMQLQPKSCLRYHSLESGVLAQPCLLDLTTEWLHMLSWPHRPVQFKCGTNIVQHEGLPMEVPGGLGPLGVGTEEEVYWFYLSRFTFDLTCPKWTLAARLVFL